MGPGGLGLGPFFLTTLLSAEYQVKLTYLIKIDT
jgi:hypothetical protein